jgi:hypothetical protein
MVAAAAEEGRGAAARAWRAVARREDARVERKVESEQHPRLPLALTRNLGPNNEFTDLAHTNKCCCHEQNTMRTNLVSRQTMHVRI